MTQPVSSPASPIHRRSSRSDIGWAIFLGLLFLLGSNQFLAPPDCASYWAWAITPMTTASLDFRGAYEQLEMPVRYVGLTPTGRLSNDWPPGAGWLLWPTVWAGPAISHAWVLFLVVLVVEALSRRFRLWGGTTWEGRLALAAVFLGTPAGFYALLAPFFSHTLSMVAVGFTVLYWDRTRYRRLPSGWFLLGLLVGISGCIRPQNLALGILPLLELVMDRRLHRSFRAIPPLGAGLFVGIFPLTVVWTVLYGSPVALPKVEEMRWLDPALSQTLLSDFHGVLPWTPVHGLAALGLLMLARRDPLLGGALFLLGTIQLYVNSANEVWWAGGSFGNRRLADYALLVGYGMMGLYRSCRNRPVAWWLSMGATLTACLWTLTLLVMERRGLLPLGRYVPWNGEFWISVGQVLKDPLTGAIALIRPFLDSLEALRGQGRIVPGWTPSNQPQIGALPLILRGLGALVLVVGVVLVRRYGSAWGRGWLRISRVMAMGALWIGVGLFLAFAGWRTPPVARTHPDLVALLPSKSLILWDNMLELALYEIIRGRPDKALVAADRAIELRPEVYSGWWYRAAALRDMGMREQALVTAQKVLTMEPNHVLARELVSNGGRPSQGRFRRQIRPGN